jgi:hypothetical protein
MYGQLKEEIKEEVVRKVYHPTIIREAPRPKNIQAVHPSASPAGNGAEGAATNQQPQAPKPVRVEKTLGRNDLCYCGSGKKYKHCHMKTDMLAGNGAAAPQKAAANSSADNDKKGSKKQARTRRR